MYTVYAHLSTCQSSEVTSAEKKKKIKMVVSKHTSLTSAIPLGQCFISI